jgi:hypothetical protein
MAFWVRLQSLVGQLCTSQYVTTSNRRSIHHWQGSVFPAMSGAQRAWPWGRTLNTVELFSRPTSLLPLAQLTRHTSWSPPNYVRIAEWPWQGDKRASPVEISSDGPRKPYNMVLTISHHQGNGQTSWLQIQRSGFDSRRYHIFWEAVVWNGVHSASWVQLRSYLEEKVARILT